MCEAGVWPFHSTFMQRSYDQIVHDVRLQNLNVTLCLDRCGLLVGEDSATHHGVFDISFPRHIPNLVIMAPSNEPCSTCWPRPWPMKAPWPCAIPVAWARARPWSKNRRSPPRGEMLRDRRRDVAQ